MFSLKRKTTGFTIVELLIVIVVIGILAGLVITTFVGVQQKARDSERKTDINGIHAQIEAYYAQNSKYPSFSQMNDEAATTGFRAVSMKGLDGAAYQDPKATAGATANDFIAAPAANGYAYVVTPAGCDNAAGGVDCSAYTLTATLEGGGTYAKSSLTN